MKNLINLLENQSINISLIWSDVSIFVASLLLVLVLILYFYAKDLRDIIAEVKEDLNFKITCYNSLAKDSIDRITYLTEVNKMTDSKNNQLIVESLENEKRIRNLIESKCVLVAEINEKDERINKLTSQVKKTKYVPLNQQKEAEIEPVVWWESMTDEYGQFPKGKLFHVGDKNPSHKEFLWLTDDFSLPQVLRSDFLVARKNFNPANP